MTRAEVAWLDEIRDASGHTDPSLTNRTHSAVCALTENELAWVECIRFLLASRIRRRRIGGSGAVKGLTYRGE